MADRGVGIEYDEADEGVATSDVVQWVALGFTVATARDFGGCCGEYHNDDQSSKSDSEVISGSVYEYDIPGDDEELPGRRAYACMAPA